MLLDQFGAPARPVPQASPFADYVLHSSDKFESRYLKENTVTGIRTWMIFDHFSGEVKIRKTQRIDRILDDNRELQKKHRRYKQGKYLPMYRIPTLEWHKLMKKCGEQGGEYDETKLRKILDGDDKDNSSYQYFKTITGKLPNNKVEL